MATDADGLDWASSIAFGKNGDLWAVNFAITRRSGAGSPSARRRDERTAGPVVEPLALPAVMSGVPSLLVQSLRTCPIVAPFCRLQISRRRSRCERLAAGQNGTAVWGPRRRP